VVRGPLNAAADCRVVWVVSALAITLAVFCVAPVPLLIAAMILSAMALSAVELSAGDACVGAGLLPIIPSTVLSALIGLPCNVARISARYSFALIAA